MKTLYKKIGAVESENKKALEEAAEVIKNGGLVAFPTETVYGLGANALSQEAAAKIYAAKGRPSDNPLIVHISSISMLSDIASDISPEALKLAEAFWPGPLTMVLKKRDIVPDTITGGLNTVAVRIPKNDVALRLINMSKLPIAGPSANSSTKPSPTCAEHVLADLDGKIDMVLDGGHTAYGLESTIVDVSGEKIKLLRPGVITAEMLIEVVGDIEIIHGLAPGEPPVSPGMKYKHYAPEAEIYIVEGTDCQVADYIKSKITPGDTSSAIITTDECVELYTGYKHVYSLGSKFRADIMGENLFDTLRMLDTENINTAYAHAVSQEGIGSAVMNRLTKAASGNIIDLNENAEPLRVLFVCTGNTCRSPMAQAILNSMGSRFQAFSRGIHAFPGSPISTFAKAALCEMGITLEGFSSAILSAEDVENTHIILCMTKNHVGHIKAMFPQYEKKVYTIYQYIKGSEKDVIDPFGGDLKTYRKCAVEIKSLLEKFAGSINHNDFLK